MEINLGGRLTPEAKSNLFLYAKRDSGSFLLEKLQSGNVKNPHHGEDDTVQLIRRQNTTMGNISHAHAADLNES